MVQDSASKDKQVLYWHCTDCNKNVVGVFKLIKIVQEREDKMEKDVAELKKK